MEPRSRILEYCGGGGGGGGGLFAGSKVIGDSNIRIELKSLLLSIPSNQIK